MTEHRGAVLVVIPTFNEAQSLWQTLQAVHATAPDVDILVVDDGSPDGTGDIADAVAQTDSRVHVLHRQRKRGLGAAYLSGFRWGLGRDYDVLVEMDADGSHRAEHLPAMLAALADADVVIGSRWVSGGDVENWPRRRETLSRAGNAYARTVLGLSVHDSTAGFRAYRREALEAVDLRSVHSQGYCFQVDVTRRCARAGLRIVEIPITFVERTQGESKMSRGIVAEAMWRITAWGLVDRTSQLRRRVGSR